MITIENRVPVFRRGNILDKIVLDTMRDIPYEYYTLTYSDYSDGVICGIKTYVQEEKIYITEGIIKFNGYYHKIKETVNIEIPLADGDYLLKVKFLPAEMVEREKYQQYIMEIFFSLDEKMLDNEIELLRIMRREGAEIRNPLDFMGLDREYNIVNEVNKPQSTPSGKAFSDTLVKMYARKIFEEKEMEHIDEIFCSMGLNMVLSRELIDMYIGKRLREDSSESSAQEIYEYLKKIYSSMRNSRYVKTSSVTKKNIMMVE